MSEPFPFGPIASSVPTLGQRVKVVQHYHTYVMQCQCEAKTVSVIIGDGKGVMCPRCGGTPSAQLEEARVQVGFGSPLDLVPQ